MKQNISFLFDGTNMKMSDESNVFKLYSILKYGVLVARNELDLETKNKFTFYYEGPGSIDEKINGIAFGKGFIGNLKSAYRRITNAVLKDGIKLDECVLALFGFSRGAYTARVFAHLLSDCGVQEDINLCDDTVEDYLFSGKSGSFTSNIRIGKIDVLGLFDTVRSTLTPFSFDEKLASSVVNCFHAMAMDESRLFFNLLKFEDPSNMKKIDSQWFAGAHIDIGGGKNANGTELSNITLSWMIEKCREAGLDMPRVRTTNNDSEFSNSGNLGGELNLPIDICGKLTDSSDLPEICPREYNGEAINIHALERIKIMGGDYVPRLRGLTV